MSVKRIHQTFKHAFIPHEGNEYRPHFFREHIILSLTVVSVVMLLTSLTAYLVLRKTTYGTLVISNVLIDMTNETRTSLGLPPLIRNDSLQTSSTLKAKDMAKYQYFAHDSPDGSTPWRFFKEAHYDYAYAGENLALNFITSRQTHEGWMNSPKHRDNIVDPKFQEIGISVLSVPFNDKTVLFAVQHFGLPKSEIIKREVPNYGSLADTIIFSGSYYIENAYFFLIALILIAIIILLIVEFEKQHKKHILYGILLLILVIVCTLINAELLV